MKPSKLYRRLIPLTLIPGALAVDKLLMRFFDYSVVNLIYTRAAGSGARPCLLMTTMHWGSGRLRTVVLPYHQSGEQYVVIGSLAGRPNDPVWASNVRVHPTTWLRVGGKDLCCRAHIAQGDERAQLWKEISGDGSYLAYAKRAHPRILPLVVHTPIDRSSVTKPDIDRVED